MAEVGLVRFSQVALDVARATVPRYRTTFSKQQFTQPELLAILCLMRYEDWTFREAEVRQADHSELRRALWQLIRSVNGTLPLDLRARAMLLLYSIYALRSSEVSGL